MNITIRMLGVGEGLPGEVEEFLEKNEYTHLWQSPLWFTFRKSRNEDFSTLIAYQGKKVVGAAQVIYPRVLRWFKYAYVARGPVWLHTAEGFAELLDAIRNNAEKRDCVFVKIDPPVQQFTRDVYELIQMRCGVKQKRRIIPTGTAYIDIRKDEESIRNSFSKKARYSIRKAENAGVEIVSGTSVEDYNQYLSLVEKTEKRQSFKQRGPEFFESLLNLYHFEAPIHLLLAQYKRMVIAGGIFVEYQQRFHYLSGAFDDVYKHLQGASLLMFGAMKTAHKNGLDYFDFFSYSSGESEEFISIDKFKDSFNPHIEKWEEGIDVPLRKKLYRLYSIVN